MKRYGNLFDRVTSFDTLLLAAQKAMRGKRDRTHVAHFWFYLEPELLRLQEEFRSGAYRMRPYRTFTIYEPKRRQICAAAVFCRLHAFGVMIISGSNRVIRGGSWNNDARNCRSANRNNGDPGNANRNIGFRLLSTWQFARGKWFTDPFRAPGHVQIIILRRQGPDK